MPSLLAVSKIPPNPKIVFIKNLRVVVWALYISAYKILFVRIIGVSRFLKIFLKAFLPGSGTFE